MEFISSILHESRDSADFEAPRARRGDAQCEHRVRPFGGMGEGQAREGTAIATADNGRSGQKNNRCFRAYGIVRRILRTILAL